MNAERIAPNFYRTFLERSKVLGYQFPVDPKLFFFTLPCDTIEGRCSVFLFYPLRAECSWSSGEFPLATSPPDCRCSAVGSSEVLLTRFQAASLVVVYPPTTVTRQQKLNTDE